MWLATFNDSSLYHCKVFKIFWYLFLRSATRNQTSWCAMKTAGRKLVLQQPVCPDLAIFCFLGKHAKPVATIILPKSPSLLGNFCKGVKFFHFLVKSFLGQLVIEIGRFFLFIVLPTYTVTSWVKGTFTHEWRKFELDERKFLLIMRIDKFKYFRARLI